VQLLAEIRAAQEELGERIGKRGLATAASVSPADPHVFARSLGTVATTTEVRATHRRPKRRYKKRIRMPSKLDPYLLTIENWLSVEPQITALAIVRRLTTIDPSTFSDKQHSIVQRLLRSFRQKVAETVIASMPAQPMMKPEIRPGLWTALRVMITPPRPQPLQRAGLVSEISLLLSSQNSVPVTFLPEAIRGVKVRRRSTNLRDRRVADMARTPILSQIHANRISVCAVLYDGPHRVFRNAVGT
jgi:hypothetical protein